MKVSDVLTEVEMNMEETQNQRDARVEQLWRKLDHQQRGELDWRGLQQGLRKIDHRENRPSSPRASCLGPALPR